VISGLIRRRILLNYRVSPEVATTVLPSNFRPKLVRGFAIAGICLIRLEQIRPKGVPAFIGVSSENAAHRIAVEWTDNFGELREGVFVSRRDTNSRLNSLAGGRVFPVVHHHSLFTVFDRDGKVGIRVEADDFGSPLIEVEGEPGEMLPENSVFPSVDESSRFFETGCIGYSSRPGSCILDGLSLTISGWRVSPLRITRLRSAYYDDPDAFPPEEIEFDHALLMRDIPHEWHAEPEMAVRGAAWDSALTN